MHLNADRGWFGDASSLRFAAMTAVSCSGSPQEVASSIRRMAEEINRLSGWFGELKSPLRFIMAAILVLNRDDASEFLAEVERARELFRHANLRRGGIYETMAILVMRLQNDLQPVSEHKMGKRVLNPRQDLFCSLCGESTFGTTYAVSFQTFYFLIDLG